MNVLCGLSGGINSAALACWFVEKGYNPAQLHLYYAHLIEHSPDTFQFVADCIRFVRQYYPQVRVKITKGSVLKYFAEQKMIPHPKISPCTRQLKTGPMDNYCLEHGIQVDLIGYVREERDRIVKARQKGCDNLFTVKDFPIGIFSEEWCFEIVDRYIGWHPAIYDIRDGRGKRLFSHNNCLPCKNMHIPQMMHVAKYFPEYMSAAVALSTNLQSYWGREAEAYYTTFGREDYEPGQCSICAFD